MRTSMVSDLLRDMVEGSAATWWDEYPEVAGASLRRIFPGSVIMFVSEDANMAERRMFRVDGERVPAWRPRVLGEVISEHPMIQSYCLPGASVAPRRMSDILSQLAFERTRTYQELFRPSGMRYQMTVLTRDISARRGRSWVLQRHDRDFSDAELETARRLQDLLILLDDAAQRLAGPCSSSDAMGEPRAAPHSSLVSVGRLDNRGQDNPAQSIGAGDSLTPPCPAAADRQVMTDRELQVLALVADGLTADAIGHVLGISSRTVSKHLEHAYGKLGRRDRLLAVRQAERLGLLKSSSH